ncbi:MAG: DNA polymerase/3'-5' exonuclease PolX, partial [Chloroflexi bacterium]|nr:DNA polymerase/3'-5' exonuclease PolX [Chloroflexota bacterium]
MGRSSNKELASIFRELADMLEMKGDTIYKIIAYRKAADNIEHATQDVAVLWQQGRLREVPGIGESIAAKIQEYLTTGRVALQDQLREEMPPGVLSLRAIPGVGPKTAWLLYQRLGITSVAEVERAAKEGKLRGLPGMGERSEEKILQGIEMLHRRSERIPLGIALPVAQALLAGLQGCSQVLRLTTAGSLRRYKPTVGDIDILAVSREPQAVVRFFAQLPEVAEVVSQGDTKSTVLLADGLQIDLMVLEETHYGSLLQHFTGSKDHNVHLRELALDHGLSLSEYGFTKPDGGVILCPEEEDVYLTLELDYIPPELREDAGEVEAARERRLPRLVQSVDLKGDLHVHSTWSDGVSSIREMAQAAKARGYEYIAVTDHTKSLGIARGLTVDRLQERQAEIEEVNRELAPFRVLSGVEVEVKADGTLDLPDDVLAKLDLVVASVHSGLRQERDRITGRVLAAMRNPHVDIIGHPTGVILGEREPYDLNFAAILREAV